MPENKLEIFSTKEEAAKRLFKQEVHYKAGPFLDKKTFSGAGKLVLTNKQAKQGQSKSRANRQHYIKTQRSNKGTSPMELLGYEIDKFLTSHLPKSPQQPDYRLLLDNQDKILVNKIASKAVDNTTTWAQAKNQSQTALDERITYGIASNIIGNDDLSDWNVLVHNKTNEIFVIDVNCTFEAEHFERIANEKWRNVLIDSLNAKDNDKIKKKACIAFYENYAKVREALVVHIVSILEAIDSHLDKTKVGEYSYGGTDLELCFREDQNLLLRNKTPYEQVCIIMQILEARLALLYEHQKGMPKDPRIAKVLSAIANDPMTPEKIQEILFKNDILVLLKSYCNQEQNFGTAFKEKYQLTDNNLKRINEALDKFSKINIKYFLEKPEATVSIKFFDYIISFFQGLVGKDTIISKKKAHGEIKSFVETIMQDTSLSTNNLQI
jgi:hypothetical protein